MVLQFQIKLSTICPMLKVSIRTTKQNNEPQWCQNDIEMNYYWKVTFNGQFGVISMSFLCQVDWLKSDF